MTVPDVSQFNAKFKRETEKMQQRQAMERRINARKHVSTTKSSFATLI